jgi:hypothetical protein
MAKPKASRDPLAPWPVPVMCASSPCQFCCSLTDEASDAVWNFGTDALLELWDRQQEESKIPSDAHLCPSCKLCPGNDGGLCEQCLDMICEWSSDWNWPEASVIREFRDLARNGIEGGHVQ